jgi:iron complex transport system substrate-binding protein
MESSALGRAEWMKFYGMLFGKEKEADSLFAAVEKNYMSLRDKVSSFKSQVAGKHRPSPKILMDKQTGSVWYVPGGRSTIGRLIADAGADYPWQGDDHSGSLPLSFESVLEKGGPCDIWLFRYNSPHAITAKELLSEKPAYSQFKAFQKGEIYGCNTATSTFYEDTPFRPDLLLRDFITICFPELGLGESTYFVKIQH